MKESGNSVPKRGNCRHKNTGAREDMGNGTQSSMGKTGDNIRVKTQLLQK